MSKGRDFIKERGIVSIACVLHSLTARLGSNHVEPVFEWNDGTITAWQCTIDYPVRCMFRNPRFNYDPPRWKVFTCTFTPEEQVLLWDFFVAQENKPYNFRGLYCNFFSLLRCCCGTAEGQDEAWFCSEMLMAALKHVRPQEFSEYMASRTNIGDLFYVMHKHRCFSKAIQVMGDPQEYGMQFV